MSDPEANKQIIRDFLQTVWAEGDLDALPRFWTPDCVNHAAPAPDGRGLDALRAYHEGFLAALAAFSDVQTGVVQQVAEGDRVVTHLLSRATHSGPFGGVPATGRPVTLAAIRIDRLDGGRIAEHWSVSDLTGLMRQIGTWARPGLDGG
jgi:predicted ester cyclase